jgi:hypothetical protein
MVEQGVFGRPCGRQRGEGGCGQQHVHDHDLVADGAMSGSTPARISPVIAPGRLISPTTLVESIAGSSAVRSADH